MTIHRFKPSHYHNTIGSHPPALTIADGDQVITTTVDARGYDASGSQVTRPGNPQTGPFYVRGAEPGDTLAVTFDVLRPNRRQGWSQSVIAPNVVDPEYVRRMPEPSLITWEVDVDAGTAAPVDPTPPWDGLVLPVRPMLGCFGVAPPGGQAITTATSGTHGGNMDYRGFVQGVTAYLPVFTEGALFHLGDGHALQGDGEIVGTGVEISMDVAFTVRVLKGGSCRWPRGENEHEIFACGNARPLDQAIQHATTEMVRWLIEDHGFDPRSAHLLLGQAVKYRVGNVFDPAYTAVCALDKEWLPPGSAFIGP